MPQDFHFVLLFTKKCCIHPDLGTSTTDYTIHDSGKICKCVLSAEAIDSKSTVTGNKHPA